MPRVSEMLPAASSITPTSGLWDALDFETRTWLEGIAANVKVLLGRCRSDDAFDELESYGLDVELQAAIWTRFDSGERRVLNAVMAARKERA